MADRILVPFQGEGGGRGALSWGQRVLWDAMRDKHTWMPIGTVKPLPTGTTIDQVVDDLRFLMRHYPTLRTRLRFGPGAEPEQVVSESGEVALEVVDAGGEDPAEVAERVRRRYWDGDYDFTGEWPVRMAVIRHGGRLTHRVWVMCHLATDANGAAIMATELAGRDATGSAGSMAPLEQARWQRSDAGRRQNTLALRHWERLLRTVPARRFPDPTHRTRPRYWNGTFTSRALRLAVDAAAARAGAASATVLLAVFAMALSRVTGIHPVVTRVVVNNRFRSGLASTVSPVVQNGLCALDVAGAGLDEAVARVRRQAMAAYKHACYDPVQLAELLATVCRERGEYIDIGCFFNDRRQDQRTGPVPAPEQVRAALPASTLRWDEKYDDRPYDPLFVTVDDPPDGFAVLVYIDTHRVPPEAAEACVRGMEAIAVAAVSAAGVEAL